MTVDRGEARSITRMFCAWCGSALVMQARFCPGCGHAVEGPSAASDPDWFAEPDLAEPEPFEPDLAEPEPVDEPADEQTVIIDSLLRHDHPVWHEHPVWQEHPATTGAGGEAPGTARAVSTPARRWLLICAIALVLLLLASVAATAGYRYMRNQPAMDAFEAGQRTFTQVAAGLALAEDLEQVAVAGRHAVAASDSLESRRKTAARVDSDLANAISGVLEAEVAVAAAGATLVDLDEEHLAVWGDTYDALSSSLAALATATKVLATQDSEAALAVPDTTSVLENLEEVVGSAVAESAEGSLTAAFDDLARARTTSDVREIADVAAQERAAVRAAAEGLHNDSETAERLGPLVAVYSAVAELSALDGESLGEWGDMRQALTGSLAAVTWNSPVASAGRDAVTGLGRLVARAETRLSDWQAEYDAAVADKAADAAALEEYHNGMQAQLRAYSALRSDLAEWVARVEDPTAYVTYEDAYSTLSQAQWDRQVVRDAMNALTVPEEVQGAHAELVSVVDDAIAAIQAAYDGATDSDYCMTSCFYKDTPGWQLFSAESDRITEAYRSAEKSWKSAVTAAESGVSERELPRKPQV